MRRALTTSLRFSAVGLALTFFACATAPVDDFTVTQQEQNSAPAETAKVPTTSTPKQDDDAAVPKSPSDGGAQDASDAAPPPPPPPVDSGTSTGGSCNLDNALKVAYYQYQLTQQSSPVLCPCAAGQCCYLFTCVNE